MFLQLFRDVNSIAGNLISWQSTGVCQQHTYRAPHFLMHSCCTDLFFLVVRVYSHALTQCTCMAQVTKHTVCVSPNTCTPHPSRAMSHTLQNLTPRTGTPSSPFPESVFQRAEQPCEDERPQQSGALTESPPFTPRGHRERHAQGSSTQATRGHRTSRPRVPECCVAWPWDGPTRVVVLSDVSSLAEADALGKARRLHITTADMRKSMG